MFYINFFSIRRVIQLHLIYLFIILLNHGETQTLAILPNGFMFDESNQQANIQKFGWESYLKQGDEYLANKNYAEAEKSYNKALKEAKKLGKRVPEIAACLNKLADFYHSQRDFYAAIDIRKKALKIEEEIYGPNSIEVAKSMYHIVQSKFLDKPQSIRKNFDELSDMLEKCLKIQESTLGSDHLDICETLDLQAIIEITNLEAIRSKIPDLSVFQGFGPVTVNFGGIEMSWSEYKRRQLRWYSNIANICRRSIYIKDKQYGMGSDNAEETLKLYAFCLAAMNESGNVDDYYKKVKQEIIMFQDASAQDTIVAYKNYVTQNEPEGLYIQRAINRISELQDTEKILYEKAK